jgi:signal transduction histidine kinase
VDLLQVLSLGAAVGIDTMLLSALVDRRNRRFVQLPLLLLLAGTWMWHAGLLSQVLLPSGVEARFSLAAALLGALLMPCAMSHALVRLWTTGFVVRERADPRHLLAYLPLLVLPAATWLQVPFDSRLATLVPLALPYLLWSSVLNVAAGVTFMRLGPRPVHRLLLYLAWLFLGQALLQLMSIVVIAAGGHDAMAAILLLCALSPALVVLTATCFVVWFGFLHLVLDRALVYGGLLMAFLVGHQIMFQAISVDLPQRYGPALVFLEAAAILVLVAALPSLRQRAAEALRYLLGERMAVGRERLHRLATDLSAQAGRAPLELLDWFAAGLRAALDVEFVGGWVFHPDGTLRTCCGDAARLDENHATELRRAMMAAGLSVCTRRDTPGPEGDACFQTGGAALAVLRTHRTLTGLLLLGRHRRNRELNGEEINAILLIVEQLVITLDNSLLQAERLAAERRAAQGEKLSALGLLASSVAHEIKNPLSAIKTIVTVLAEDLTPDSPHAEDLRLILGEVDRLRATTTQLLDFARPRCRSDGLGCVETVLANTVRVVRHLAGQRNIVLETRLIGNLPRVRADELSLREIFFNLLSNSLEATEPGGRVVVACSLDNAYVKAEVMDTGPGVAPEVRQRLFEPFLTTKEQGNGLGLYVVGRRVRELGGLIDCTSDHGNGTTFTVKFLAAPVDHPACHGEVT